MNFNEIIIEIIKSPYIKDCIAASNHQFSYGEQITIIINSDEELSRKRDILKMYLESSNVTKVLDKLYISNLQNIVNEMSKVIEYIDGGCSDIILTYKTDTDLHCASNLDKLLAKISDNTSDSIIEIDIHNINTVEEVGYIILNKDKKPTRYCLTDGVDCDLYNCFVNIPNDIHIGDVVTTIGNNEKFIVVSNTIMPNKFKNDLTYDDASIVVIPINLLDSNKDYKKQIEEIYTDRINNIENPYAKPDIIMKYYTSINLLEVHK